MAKKYSNDDHIVTLQAANGEDIEFVECAGIVYRGNFYSILQPVELLEGMDDDEALVFKVTKVRGKRQFEIELDDNVIDGVFAEYDRLCKESENSCNKQLKKGSSKSIVSKAKDAAVGAVSLIVKIICYIIIGVIAAASVMFLIAGILSNEVSGIVIGVIGLVIAIAGLIIERRKSKKRRK